MNNVNATINSGVIHDKDYISMSSDNAISYDLGNINPGDTRFFNLFICLKNEKNTRNNMMNFVQTLKKVDIDISAFVYHNDTLKSLDDVVWYKHTDTQTLHHSGDNRDGEGEGDDEKISIKLDGLNPDVNRIRLVATIYDFKDRGQNFGSAKNAFLTLHNDDENGKEEMRINLTGDYSMFVGIAVGDLVKKENSWQFVSIAEGYADDLNVIVNKNINAK